MSASSDIGSESFEMRIIAQKVRASSRKLVECSYAIRQKILLEFARSLIDNEQNILLENQKDIQAADHLKINNKSSFDRLIINTKKIQTLAKGIEQIAACPDPIDLNSPISIREISPELILSLVPVPIGVLLVIFESRPDVLPQLVALCIASGNGVLLKGGKESSFTLAILYKLAIASINKCTDNFIKGDELIVLVSSRESILSLLSLNDLIDLVIPRGSSEMVKYIQDHTKIPVMGHAEGICHVYIDEAANLNKSKLILLDSKTDYPAACNSMETLLIHESLTRKLVDGEKIPFYLILIKTLIENKVKCIAGPKLFDILNKEHNNADNPRIELEKLEDISKFHFEYSNLTCAIEIVSSVDEAIDHIHKYGSGHTESIVTENEVTAQSFIKRVDSACVFHNSSTRFADGYRFGLGAEVGISTGRLHARGPVGVEGLTTTKWILKGKGDKPFTVKQFSDGERLYTHKLI